MALSEEDPSEIEEIVGRDPLLAELSRQASPYPIGKEPTMRLSWEDIHQMEREQDRKYLEATIDELQKEKQELEKTNKEVTRKAFERERKTRRQTIDALEGVLANSFPNDYQKYADVINERLTRKEHEDLLGLFLQSSRCASLDSFVALL